MFLIFCAKNLNEFSLQVWPVPALNKITVVDWILSIFSSRNSISVSWYQTLTLIDLVFGAVSHICIQWSLTGIWFFLWSGMSNLRDLFKTPTSDGEHLHRMVNLSNTHIKCLSVSASVVIIIVTRLLSTSTIITQYFNHLLTGTFCSDLYKYTTIFSVCYSIFSILCTYSIRKFVKHLQQQSMGSIIRNEYNF